MKKTNHKDDAKINFFLQQINTVKMENEKRQEANPKDLKIEDDNQKFEKNGDNKNYNNTAPAKFANNFRAKNEN